MALLICRATSNVFKPLYQVAGVMLPVAEGSSGDDAHLAYTFLRRRDFIDMVRM